MMALSSCQRLFLRGQMLTRFTKSPFAAARPTTCASSSTISTISKIVQCQFASSAGCEEGTNIVYLRGLPWKVTTKDVSNFLNDCDIVNEGKGIHLVRRKDGRLTGDCFVELSSPSDVEKAKAHDREFIGQRYIQVFDAEQDELEEYLGQKPADSDQTVFLCVQGLPKHVVTKDEIIRFLEDKVEIFPYQITLTLDESGLPSGEAFIEFASEDDRQKALEKNNDIILGRRHGDVKIFTCSKGDKEARNSKTGHMVLMRGLPFEATEGDVRRFLDPYEPVEVRLMWDMDHKSRGICEVDFSSHDGAVLAMSKHKQYMGRRYIEMFIHSKPG